MTKLLTRSDPRWWVAVGGWRASGWTAKWNIGFLVGGAAASASRSRRPPGRCCAAGTWPCGAVSSPSWPRRTSSGRRCTAGRTSPSSATLNQQAGANRALYWPTQAVYTSIALVPLWVGGLALGAAGRAAARRSGSPRWSVIVAAVRARRQGRTTRAAIYTFCFAAGAIGAAPAGRCGARAAVYCAAAAVSAVIALPLLPAAALARFPVQKVNYDLGEEIGWPSQVALVARAYDSLPASERAVGRPLSPATTARRARSTGTGRRSGCRRPSAAPTTSGCGGRRPPAIPSPSRSTRTRRCCAAGSARSGWRPSTGTASASPTTRRAR